MRTLRSVFSGGEQSEEFLSKWNGDAESVRCSMIEAAFLRTVSIIILLRALASQKWVEILCSCTLIPQVS